MHSRFHASVQLGFRIPCHGLYSGFQSPEFRNPPAKISQIPDCTRKNLSDPGIHGTTFFKYMFVHHCAIRKDVLKGTLEQLLSGRLLPNLCFSPLLTLQPLTRV